MQEEMLNVAFMDHRTGIRNYRLRIRSEGPKIDDAHADHRARPLFLRLTWKTQILNRYRPEMRSVTKSSEMYVILRHRKNSRLS